VLVSVQGRRHVELKYLFEDLPFYKDTASSDITSFSAHIADLAEFLGRLVALAVCADGVGVKVAASTSAVSILNEYR
jgi:hypothetical protein